MIDQDLINKLQFQIDENSEGYASTYFDNNDIQSLVNNYKSLIEQNAELHKELALYKVGLEYVADRVFVVNDE